MSWYSNQNDPMRRFQSALRQSAQYQNAQYQNAQLEALYARQQALARQQYLFQQQQAQRAAQNQRIQLGMLIKSRRMALNADLFALAQFCGIPPETVLNLETGNSGTIPFDTVLLVMQALGLQLSAFPQV